MLGVEGLGVEFVGGFRVYSRGLGLGRVFGVWGLGFKGLGFRSLGLMVWGLGFRIYGLGFRGLRAQGFGRLGRGQRSRVWGFTGSIYLLLREKRVSGLRGLGYRG